MHSECSWIKKHLIEVVEGSITTEESNRYIEGHLRVCSKCAILVKKFQMTWEMLESPERIEASPSFESSLLRKIQECHKGSIIGETRAGLLKVLRPVMLTAGLFIALFFGYHLGNISKEGPASMGPNDIKEAGYVEYSSGDLSVLNDYSLGSATDFLLNFNVVPKEDSP
ncbi:MAG: hypothetical protein ABIJ35_06470 [Acidobacteriota bacterium]